MSETTGKIGALLLAAGGSSRMGQPKQLFVYQGKTLLRRAVETLLDTTCSTIIVVLGAEYERTKNEIDDLPVGIIRNENWQTGMGSSIKTGLEHLLQTDPDVLGVIIMLCDQPDITASEIDLLANRFCETGCEIVAAQYSDTVGVPALFGKRFFTELLNLEGDKGAKNLIRSQSANLSIVQIPEAAFDIDTPEDLLIKNS
jgi:molybdenum cofactor cytidylyltransferase